MCMFWVDILVYLETLKWTSICLALQMFYWGNCTSWQGLNLHSHFLVGGMTFSQLCLTIKVKSSLQQGNAWLPFLQLGYIYRDFSKSNATYWSTISEVDSMTVERTLFLGKYVT